MTRRLWVLAAIAAALPLSAGGTARADTLYTGVLSPDTVYLMCKRAGANYFNFRENGYGCHNSNLTISCRADLQCVSRVRDLNSYEGNTLAAFMRQHGMRQVDPLSRSYSE